jgi:hypothetical protein
MIISSCETIGEGIDTKNANMCVFVDPKSSYVKIIQNIGRIVRKQQQISTILIPCWVDKTKYLECNGDRDKCDEVIREDMSETGNFNGILNVLSALKQEDEDLYDICLHYPDTYSPQEIQSNLERQGYVIEECVGTIMETMEHLLDVELDYEKYEECETDEEMIMNIAEENNVCVEIHTNSLENPVERYNGECESGEIIRLYKNVDEETEEDIYQPIVKKEQKTKRNRDNVSGPKRENRLNIKVHANPDIKVLWNITSDIDLTKDICSCVIDCEVVDKWYDNFESVKAFMSENKKKPSRSSENEIEKKLGQWIYNHNRNYKEKIYSMKDNAKCGLWTEFLEEYKEYFKSVDDIWYETLENVKIFMSENKKKPSLYSKNKMEKKIGIWVSHQCINYNQRLQTMKDDKKYNLWTKMLEEYKDYFKTNNDIWYDTLENVKTFISEKKKRPSQDSKNDIEKKLGKWLNHQISNYKQKKEAMKDEKKNKLWTEFLEEFKEYIVFSLEYKPKEKSNDDVWYERLDNLKTFMNEKKKRPSEDSKNESEKKLGQWVTHQCKYYKQNMKAMKDKKKYKLWTKLLEEFKEYFKSNDDVWYETFENVKIFINKNKKKPSQHSKNENETKMGQWLSRQNSNYTQKNKTMKDEKKYNAWTQFLEEYNLYFGNIDSLSVASLTDIQTEEEYNLDSKMSPEELEEYENQSEETFEIIPKKKSMKLKTPSTKPKKETTEQKRERVKTEISQLHKRYKTMKSENLHKEFNENRQLWNNYHEISEENEKSFPEDDIPRNRVIAELLKIKTKRTKIVVDMGCGKGQISKYFSNDSRFQFINYDHISNDPSIISCDISNLPLEEDAVEICILSLAMWGSNCKEYVKEANRILESGGKLYIIEPTKRWSEQDDDKNIVEGKEGSKMKQLLEECGFQIVEQSIEKFCLFVCIKV